MRSTLTLPVLGAAALATAIAGVIAVPQLQPLGSPLTGSVTAQGAVAPTPLVLLDEQGHVAQRKAHSRAVTAAAVAAREKAAAEKAAADAAAKAAADREKARASRARRAETGDPRSIARAMLAARGQAGQFGCLDRLWTKESNWQVRATNPSSGAYGIPQSLPAGKMASAGSDWRTNPRTQIRWGLGYISQRYGSPCAAWSHSQAKNWY